MAASRRRLLPCAGGVHSVATPDRRRFAVQITSYPSVDIFVPFEWNATATEVTERVGYCAC
jgi:hypothetical protein